VSTRYDLTQNDTSITYNNTYEAKKTYDANNNLVTLANTYDSSARETSRHYGNFYSQQTAYD